MQFIEYCAESVREVVWVQTVVSILVVDPHDGVADWGLLCHSPASWERIVSHITNPEKDPNSKFEIQFSWTRMVFAPSWSQKILSQTILSQGPSVVTRDFWYPHEETSTKPSYYFILHMGRTWGRGWKICIETCARSSPPSLAVLTPLLGQLVPHKWSNARHYCPNLIPSS